MLASHITNKEVSKQKILYPVTYMVRRMSIGYDIHDKLIIIILTYYLLYL